MRELRIFEKFAQNVITNQCLERLREKDSKHYVLDEMQMPLALLTIRMIPESSGRRCLQCHALPMAPFLQVAALTIYVIKNVAAHLRFLQSQGSQLPACAQDTAERTAKSLNGWACHSKVARTIMK